MSNLKDFQSSLATMPYSLFEDFVADIILATGKFINIDRNIAVGDGSGTHLEVDISTLDNTSEDDAPKRTYFEVKKRDLLTIDVIEAIVGKYKDLRAIESPAHMIIVTSGSISDSARKWAKVKSVELWDAGTLAELATPELLAKYIGSDTGPVKASDEEIRKHTAFLQSLHSIDPGRKKWSAFQQLTTEIFEYLFCPPLRPPIPNHPDVDSSNIRDMIVENSAPNGFWSILRETYAADYIVVDAKNNRSPIGKRPVLDIAYYLKSYGCGLFGILITRKGVNRAGESTIREQWIAGGKMIVVLSDADIEEMLMIKSSGGSAEEIVRDKIAKFRMSL